jgi:hypothetical protein
MPFFLRSAQRFFIAIDSRFLPAGVRPPRLRFFEVVPLGLPTFFLPPPEKADPKSAEIARPSLSLSFAKSATNFSRSKVRSFGALAFCSALFFSTQAHGNTYSICRLNPIRQELSRSRRENVMVANRID